MAFPMRASLVVAFMLVLGGSHPVGAQSLKGSWILGTWEGRHIAPTIPEDTTRFEFVDEDGVIKWTMDRKGQIRLRRSTPGGDTVQNGEWQASGTVKRISQTAVELEGKYDRSSFPAVVGRAVVYELKGGPDALEGYLVGAQNVHFPISLRRVK